MLNHYHGKHAKASRSSAAIAFTSVTAALALLLTGGMYLSAAQSPQPQAAEAAVTREQPRSDLLDNPNSKQAPEAGHAQPAVQSEPSGTAAPEPAPTPPQEPPPAAYDFSQPVPASAEVDNSYFDDAAFIGDSRTDGFMLYSGIGTGKNLTSNGLSIFKLATRKALTIDGTDYTLLEALALEQYGKVYLSLGVNELGYRDDQGFYDHYCKAIDSIRASQPNAVIYIQGLIPLNEAQIAASTGRTYLTNERVRCYNDLMRRASQDKQVVFLDLYTEFADENGSLSPDASRDGVHLKRDYCKRWLAYLKTHTVNFDTLYPGGIPSNTADEGSGQV